VRWAFRLFNGATEALMLARGFRVAMPQRLTGSGQPKPSRIQLPTSCPEEPLFRAVAFGLMRAVLQAGPSRFRTARQALEGPLALRAHAQKSAPRREASRYGGCRRGGQHGPAGERPLGQPGVIRTGLCGNATGLWTTSHANFGY
jgi:hypothetical protein